MISYKELGYVSEWPNRVPYPGYEYAQDALLSIKEDLEHFKKNYDNTKFNISFSNNDEIEFEIMAKNLCHILGIDYKNLMSDYWKNVRKDILKIDDTETINSYYFLEKLLDNYDRVLEYDEKTDRNKMLNYYKLSIKSQTFKNFDNLLTSNFGCINFNNKEFERNAGKNSPGVDKFFYFLSDEIVSPYFLLGLVENNGPEYAETGEKPYVIQTTLSPYVYQNYFNNQEVVIPNQVIIDRNGILEKKETSASIKINILNQYKSLVKNNNLPDRINIYGDYVKTLKEEARIKKLI